MVPDPRHAPDGFHRVISVNDWKSQESEICLNLRTTGGKQATAIFRALTPGIWNISFIPPGVKLADSAGIFPTKGKKPVSLNIEKSGQNIQVKSSRIHLEIGTGPWNFTFRDLNGRKLLGENISDVDGLGQPFVLPLGYVAKQERAVAVTDSFSLAPEEALFGLGEKFTPLNKVGQRIVSWTVDALGSTSERSHKNIPLLISSRGYGLFLNCSARIAWDLGNISTQSYSICLESPVLSAFFIYGPSLAAILKHYHEITGQTPVPPSWSFGLWLSVGGTYRDQKSTEELAENIRKHRLPVDVFHIDTWWMRWRKYCDFQWDNESFPNVDRLIHHLHRQQMKLSLWIQPYISVESDLFEIGRQNGYFVKRPDGEVYVIEYGLSLAPRPDGIVRRAGETESWNAPVAMVDFTSPRAFRWFQDLARPVLQQGVDVFKTDFGEDIPEDAVFSNGETGKTMHNRYPLLYNQAVFEVTREEKGYGLVWARSGFAGSQQYPVCWSGDPASDWESLAATIRGGLSLGLSGIPFWSHDIGGYRGRPAPELYVRWAQFGLFCSHSRMHGDSPREPWFFGETAARIVKKYVKLRYRLFPYIYSTARESARTALPVIRAMPLAFPDDPCTYYCDLQYMFGPWILVAPVCHPEGTVRVYLPEGEWIDFHTGTVYRGPANLDLRVSLSKLPLYVRAGAIIPTMPAAGRIPHEKVDPVILEIYPEKKSSYSYLTGGEVVRFRCEQNQSEIHFSIKGKQNTGYILRLHPGGPYRSITLEKDGQTIAVDRSYIRATKKYLQIRLPGLSSGLITVKR